MLTLQPILITTTTSQNRVQPKLGHKCSAGYLCLYIHHKVEAIPHSFQWFSISPISTLCLTAYARRGIRDLVFTFKLSALFLRGDKTLSSQPQSYLLKLYTPITPGSNNLSSIANVWDITGNGLLIL